MATQIDVLAALQELDQGLSRKEQLLQDLRQHVTAIGSEMAKTEQEAEAQSQKLQELEAQHRESEGRLKLEEDKIKEKRVRLNRIRNEREMLAAQREIELMREEKGKLEEGTLLLLEQIEQENEGLGQSRIRLDELQVQHRQEVERTDSQITGLEAESRRQREERAGLIGALDPTLQSRYERIFAKCGGLAVVQIQQGTCQGCHMRLPPQLCNQIQSSQLQQSEKIYYCPHCTRIIYWPQAAGEEHQA